MIIIINHPLKYFNSGPEARAALILRRDVLAYVSEIVEAAIVIQRKVRGHVLHTKMKRLVKVRYEALGVIQRNGRKYLANKTAHFLRSQQNSEWEQLWDSNRELLYYYNYSTKRSQYTEPTEPFRPLVRDLRSAQLIQAWPDIDNRRGDIAYVPMVASNVSTLDVNSLCGVCKSRKFVRICRECYDEEDYYNTKNYNFPYCFTCFLREHTAENEKQDHEFVTTTSAEDGSSTVLRCCMCEEPAVRKCLGILSDKQIDAICNDMKRAHPDRWKSVLLSHDVGGDRKIDLMLDQITDNEPIDVVTTAHLQSIRSILQRMRSECDDCYCQNCYQEVHANGKRAKHHWKGFQEYAPVCAVCTNSPAENNCLECNSIYCESCYKVFHSMGRKRKHKTELVLEDLQQGIRRCNICKRRNGYIKCPNNRCTIHCCDSCYNFDHKFNCDKDQNNLNLQANAKGLQDNLCVNCGDPADNRCIQCNDAYCSRVERDFSGCFKLYHSKGNRVHHQQEPFKRPESRAATQSDGRIASRPDSRFSQRPNSRASTMKK